MRPIVTIALQGLLAAGAATALRSGERALSREIEGEIKRCKDLMIHAISLQDSSGSLFAEQWQQMLVLTSALIDALEIGEKSRVAPISFSSDSKIHWYLDDERAQDAEKAKQALETLPFMKGGTNTGDALLEAYEVFSQMERADPATYNNKDLIRLLFLTTDGCCTYHDVDQYPTKEAQIQAGIEALNKIPNVVVFAIGVGANICVDELRHIAGCRPSASKEPCDRVLFVDFEHMDSVMSKYIEEACSIAEEKIEETTAEAEEEQEEKQEGGNNAAMIAGGIVGGLLLVGGIGGGAYAYSTSGSSAAAEPPESDPSAEDIWDEREEAIPAETSMYS